MTRKFVLIMAALALLVTGTAVANATTFVVTSIDEFNYYNQYVYGTGPAIIENFNNSQINTPGLSIAAFGVDQGVFQLGYYQNVADDATNSYQVVTYAPGLNGFGGWFDLFNPGGPGSSINVYVGTDPTTGTFVGTIANTFAGEFWGFFSDTPFASVTLGDAGLIVGAQETYQIVDMALCTVVPLPPSAFLLGSGLLGLVGLRFRRKLS